MKPVQAHALPLIELLPVQLFNPVMSVAALAMVWQRASETHSAIRTASSVFGIIALALFAALAICYGAKLLRFPGMVKQEFKHPELSAAFGAACICLLLISRIVGNYSMVLHLVLWGFGAVAVLALNGVLIFRLMNGGIATYSSSGWLLTSVASLLVVAAGTPSTLASARELNFLAAAVGGFGSILFLQRRIAGEDKRPSLMVLVAPFALGFAAYVNLVHRVDMFAGLLFYCALFLFAVVGSRLALQPAPFSLAWWDIGFPMAALANAALVYAGQVNGPRLQLTAALLLLVLTISIVGLSVRTLGAFCTGRLLRD
jgi:tellurite resistance protein